MASRALPLLLEEVLAYLLADKGSLEEASVSQAVVFLVHVVIQMVLLWVGPLARHLVGGALFAFAVAARGHNRIPSEVALGSDSEVVMLVRDREA